MKLWSRESHEERRKRVARAREYVNLMENLVACGISGDEFAKRYLAMRRKDITPTGDLPSEVISNVFWDVEDFEGDPSLREGHTEWYDEDELRRRVGQRLLEVRAEFGTELA